jgi:hypothetical protein
MEDVTSAREESDGSETDNNLLHDDVGKEISTFPRKPYLPDVAVPESKDLASADSEPANGDKIFESLSADSPVTKTKGDSSILSASVTHQVLSSSSSSAGSAPRYLLYRDSLRSSIRSARASVTSDEPIESQLKSYFDRSLPPTAVRAGDGATSDNEL